MWLPLHIIVTMAAAIRESRDNRWNIAIVCQTIKFEYDGRKKIEKRNQNNDLIMIISFNVIINHNISFNNHSCPLLPDLRNRIRFY